MKQIAFYFDPISPFAWLAFHQLPRALQGNRYNVIYKPILFAALLKHHGQLGPAEIPDKRVWTYRHVQWLAHQVDCPLAMPAAHPFNPLPLLRLALACAMPDQPGSCNRWVADQVLRQVWMGGGDATHPDRIEALRHKLKDHMAQRGLSMDTPDSGAVKQALRDNTAEALDQGAFGVPTLVVDGHLFWGLDGLPMLKAYLDGDDWFRRRHWNDAAAIPAAIHRKK